MTAPARERRKLPRIKVDLQAQVQIIFPEVTFTPVVLHGKICDITAEGLRVHVINLSHSDYRKIIRGPRLSRVVCTFPTNPAPTRLFGKILNFDFRSNDPDSSCHLGINFGENEGTDIERLGEFIKSIEPHIQRG